METVQLSRILSESVKLFLKRLDARNLPLPDAI